MYSEGSNRIEIIFCLNNTEYRIQNVFDYNGPFNYAESQMQIDL